MTAASAKPSRTRRERRIIERPRLIKMLDETDARVILLLAPAGYGKTTLARQWAKTLNRSIWVSLGPSETDVASLAQRLADEIGEYDDSSRRFLHEFVRSRSNPQAAADEIGRVLGEKLAAASVRWLVLDDYHAIADATEPDVVLSILRDRNPQLRLLICSRVRPRWATSRLVVYNELFELRRDELAMTQSEANAVVGRRPEIQKLAARAQGWPAVVGLAASLPAGSAPTLELPDAIHEYVADELYSSADRSTRQSLTALALLPNFEPRTLNRVFGSRWKQQLEAAAELGFVHGMEPPELHPLLRKFLLAKVRDEPDSTERVRAAIAHAIDESEWETALDLVTQFDVRDLFESVLTAAYEPLRRSGRIATLARFGRIVQVTPTQTPTIVDLIDSEVALCNGQFDLSAELADSALALLPESHPLRSRAETVLGHSNFFLIDFERSEQAFQSACDTALDEEDLSQALHGLAITKIFGERQGAVDAVRQLATRQHNSPLDLARFLVNELSFRHFGETLQDPLHLDRARRAMDSIEDPRARTALAYRAAYALAQRAEYQASHEWLQRFFVDANEFVLEFAMPYAWWVQAMIELGLRRFGHAEQAIQRVEDAAHASQNENHRHNARSLRARLLMQTGRTNEALATVRLEPRRKLIPSWHGEYLATRALAFASSGNVKAAEHWAGAALATSRVLGVELLAASARAICAAQARRDATQLLARARETAVWDPVICAIRASSDLAVQFANAPDWREELEALYTRTHDHALARRAGFRTRTPKRPDDILSPRELEVLGLIARGYRNREIAEALVIANSTAKVHVRHVLEKLGVKTRAEAVARYEMFARTVNSAEDSSDGPKRNPSD